MQATHFSIPSALFQREVSGRLDPRLKNLAQAIDAFKFCFSRRAAEGINTDHYAEALLNYFRLDPDRMLENLLQCGPFSLGQFNALETFLTHENGWLARVGHYQTHDQWTDSDRAIFDKTLMLDDSVHFNLTDSEDYLAGLAALRTLSTDSYDLLAGMSTTDPELAYIYEPVRTALAGNPSVPEYLLLSLLQATEHNKTRAAAVGNPSTPVAAILQRLDAEQHLPVLKAMATRLVPARSLDDPMTPVEARLRNKGIGALDLHIDRLHGIHPATRRRLDY